MKPYAIYQLVTMPVTMIQPWPPIITRFCKFLGKLLSNFAMVKNAKGQAS